MKSFLQKTGFVIFMVIILFVGFNAIYYKTANHSRVTAFEVYDAIDRSSKQTEYTALILGDSVARQIFNPDVQKESGNESGNYAGGELYSFGKFSAE